MSYTKMQFINMAFEEIGISPHNHTLQAEQVNIALNRLDAMMATWDSQGIKVAYPLPPSPSKSNVADTTNVPDKAIEAIYLNLAVKIAPSFGKQLPIEVTIAAKKAYTTLLSSYVKRKAPPEMSLQGLPVGAGAKSSNKRFITPSSEESIQIDPNNELYFGY